MSCRQPKKILLPPELTVFLAELGQFSPLVAGELTLFKGTEITTVDAGLANPLGLAVVGESQPLSHSRAAESLTEAKSNGLSFLLRREPLLVLVRLVIDEQSEGHGMTPIDLSKNPGQPHPNQAPYHAFRQLKAAVHHLPGIQPYWRGTDEGQERGKSPSSSRLFSRLLNI